MLTLGQDIQAPSYISVTLLPFHEVDLGGGKSA